MELLFLGVYLAIWIGLGAWAANVMSEKGRSKGLGWALGLIGGIFGVIVAYVMDKKES